ncbi:MAG TPA: hypothetical protein VF808_01400 [Ktedonobacterales bacterium]
MRIDRIYAEGEALNALKALGFEIKEVSYRDGLYEVSHPSLGGARTFTVAQLTAFAEGVACAETLLRGATSPA